MSEKLKGDTSRPMTTNASNLAATQVNPPNVSVVKNPLLSASVTGLTFDDFPNKPLLLPPVAINRDPKPLVTIGSPTDVETENLDEINLNTTSEEIPTLTDSSANIGHIDPNANPLWTDTNNQPTDSILSQAASSFSALPSVASNVLSTFSKRISEYSASNSRERTPISDNGNIVSQLDIQPAYLQQQQQSQQQQHPSIQQQQYSFYNNPQSSSIATNTIPPLQNNPVVLPPEPPKFYTPTEVPNLPTPPTIAGGQNTYRLAAKKKLYAPIPGLSDQTTGGNAAPIIDPFSSSAPLQGIPPLPQPTQISGPTQSFGYVTQPTVPQLNPYESSYQAIPTVRNEERKTGGLFANISNLVPTGVLSNISGLVQTATGSLSQTPSNKSTTEELTQQTPYGYSSGYQQTPPEVSAANQYFGVNVAPPPPQAFSGSIDHNQSISTFFTPTQLFQLPSGHSNTAQLHAPPPPLVNPQQVSPLLAQPTSSASQPVPPPPTTGFVSAPPKSVTPESVKQQSSVSTTPITYFDPTKQPSTPAGYFGITEQSPANLSSGPAVGPPAVTTLPPGAVPTFDTTKTIFQPTQSALLTSNSEPPKTLTPIAIVQNQSIPTAVNHSTSQPASVFQPPPINQSTVSGIQAPLPPTAGSSTSFRLQKGTRLYKSPLTSSETAPVQVQAASLIPPPAATASFFNPFGSPSPTSASLPAQTVPTAPTLVPSYFIPQAAESSVGLFAVDKPEVDKKFNEPLQFDHSTVKSEESQFLSVHEAKQNSSEPIITTEDLGSIIQQQTIEAVPLEAEEITNPVTEATNTLLETTTKIEKQDEVLNAALEQLTLSAQQHKPTNEQQILPTEFATIEQHTVHDIKEPQVQQQPLHADNESIEQSAGDQLKIPEVLPTKLDQPPFLREQTLENTTYSKQEEQESTSHLPSSQILTTPAINPLLPPTVSNTNSSLAAQQNQNSNPFRRSVDASPFAPAPQASSVSQPKLANFFAAALNVTPSSGEDFNLFKPSQQLFPSEAQPATIPTSQTALLAQSGPDSTTVTTPSAAGLFGFVDPTQSSFIPPAITQQVTEFPPLPPQIGIAPPPLTEEQPIASQLVVDKYPLGVPPPLGFDNCLPPRVSLAESQTLETHPVATAPPIPSIDTTVEKTALPTPSCIINKSETQNSSVLNSFSNYFNQTSELKTQSEQSQKKEQQQPQPQPQIVSSSAAVISSANFFDTFAPSQPESQTTTNFNSLSIQQQQQQHQSQQQNQTQPQSNEDQRLQNFFNNPPQRENNAGVGDLGYDLVHSGLAVRNLDTLTSVSKTVEPPSSSCSEFSEWNNSSNFGSARNFPADLLTKRSPEKTLTTVESQPQPQPKIQSEAPVQSSEVPEPSVITENINSSSNLAAVENYADLPEEILRELGMANMLIGEKAAASAPPTTLPYSPAVKHWFYKRPTGTNKFVWTPFSHYDSALLETTLNMGANAPNIVAVEGGRYDVNINERSKVPVYWEGTKIEVRRCSWFYKGTDSKMVPYEEVIADLLENEYKQAVASGEWHKKIVLSMNEQVTFHGPTVIVHFQQQQSNDAWGGTSQTTTRPRVVKRDLDDFTIEQGESQRVDHLLLMVHGIGAACDLKMRSVDEVVDDFRQIAQNLVQSHYKNSTEMGLVGRVEVLPISWHSHLHSEEMGIDEKLRSITLESIPKLRNFTNNTILDVLLYTSPKFCQKIMNTVASSMNDVYNKYRERHPDFNGGVSVSGHSLGSLILFDLLCHQKAQKESEENLENPDQLRTSPMDVGSDDLSYTMGHAGTGQPFIHYAQLSFQPKKFFALGSPIGMFTTIRGIDNLGLDFRLPTCSGFYNIFHPFDPVAYRVEALVNPDLSGIRPVLIPHHKGRKRMHLELKETMTRVGADLKQRFMDTFKNTLDSVSFLGGSTKHTREVEENMTKEVDEVLRMQIEAEKQKSISDNQQTNSSQSNNESSRNRSDSVSTSHSDSDLVEIDLPLGKLNDSKRIDYVLQEAPLEFINEYIFAMGAHVCYWESEDTILFVMKEIYTGLGISPDSQVPQQTMTIERPSSRNSNTLSPVNERR